MIGTKLSEFVDELYYNPEIEFIYDGKRYMISGYMVEDCYVLEMCNINANTILFEVSSASRNDCVTAFENATIFNGQTIYEVEKNIQVLYG